MLRHKQIYIFPFSLLREDRDELDDFSEASSLYGLSNNVLFPSSWTCFATTGLHLSRLSVGLNSLFPFRESQSENCPQQFICSQAWVQVSWKWKCVYFFASTQPEDFLDIGLIYFFIYLNSQLEIYE